MPLVINYQKILLEDKKQVILDFSKVKLCEFQINDDKPLKESKKY